jgi:hypothetical protein
MTEINKGDYLELKNGVLCVVTRGDHRSGFHIKLLDDGAVIERWAFPTNYKRHLEPQEIAALKLQGLT